MCDIVLAVSRPNIVPVLIEGLKKLECHGYDSARIAVIGQGNMKCVRAIGRVAELEASSAGTSIVIGVASNKAFTTQFAALMLTEISSSRRAMCMKQLTPVRLPRQM